MSIDKLVINKLVDMKSLTDLNEPVNTFNNNNNNNNNNHRARGSIALY